MAVQEWLIANRKAFPKGILETWGLDKYADLDLSLYPVPFSELDPEVEIQRLGKVAFDTFDGLAMLVRDYFWEGITLEYKDSFPQCDGAARILESDHGELVIAGDLSGAWTQDGNPWTGEGWIHPPTSERLRFWGILESN